MNDTKLKEWLIEELIVAVNLMGDYAFDENKTPEKEMDFIRQSIRVETIKGILDKYEEISRD